ncbi:MAG: deoxyribose-phosphate aldolase [Patescibacteria group bacterium]|nr:deoxyribose-phosphate aldolase [Patescibacteria group bacterium]
MSFTKRQVAMAIDHTALKQVVGPEQIRQLCAEAKQHGFGTVCVNPAWVSLCDSLLADSAVRICSVVGFPLGENHTDTKVFEALKAMQEGADEVDMVIAIGQLIAGDDAYVRDDIAAVARAVKSRGKTLKVIIETCLLSDDQKKLACRLIAEAAAEVELVNIFAKTSTGFGASGATVADVTLMREALVGTPVQIKAAGGCKTWEDAVALMEAGATRLGTSSGVAIVTGAPADAGSY